MIRKVLYIIVLSAFNIEANSNIESFYKIVVENLKYNETYKLQDKSNEILKESIKANRYANFSIDTTERLTKAEKVSNPFTTIDISLSNKIDLFNKSRYKIKLLTIDSKLKKLALAVEKEKLFISIVEIVKIYQETKEELKLHNRLLDKEETIYNKLEQLESLGDISKLSVLRFKNSLFDLKSKIVKEKNIILNLKSQLNTYAPNETIPLLNDIALNDIELISSKNDFINNNPKSKLNSISSEQIMVLLHQIKSRYIPNVITGVNYQYNSDPTGFGNSYGVNIGINISIAKGDKKEQEALKVNSLSLNSKNKEYKIKRENEYIKRYQSYIGIIKELKILDESLVDIEKELDIVQKAFLKKYVDFNTYLESLKQYLLIKEQIIKLKYQKNLEATILNTLSKGEIYD